MSASLASGGDFASGALSGGFGAAVTPLTILLNQQIPYSGLATTVAIGGTTSALAGGDAGQGAWTAGMGYIFNQMGGESNAAQPDSTGNYWDELSLDNHKNILGLIDLPLSAVSRSFYGISGLFKTEEAPNVIFKTRHNFSRYTKDGLTDGDIASLQGVVRTEIQPIARSVENGATFAGRTQFRGQTYEYRAISRDGNIEVNTLFRVK